MPSRDIQQAKAAYKHRDREASRRAHAASAYEKHQQSTGRYIKSVIYGGLDGIITTFAVVAGVAGADLSAGVVLILGFANLIADGLSMAIGDFLSTRAENEYNAAERQREAWEVENYPEGEKKEMVEIYMEKGLSEDEAKQVVEILSRHPEVWIDTMMVEELGILESDESPLGNAAATFLSFGAFGFVPLAAPLAAMLLPGAGLGAMAFPAACALTALTLFALGALKVRITGRHWLRSGFEMLLVGGLAAVAAYGVGAALAGLA